MISLFSRMRRVSSLIEVMSFPARSGAFIRAQSAKWASCSSRVSPRSPAPPPSSPGSPIPTSSMSGSVHPEQRVAHAVVPHLGGDAPVVAVVVLQEVDPPLGVLARVGVLVPHGRGEALAGAVARRGVDAE